MNVQNLLLCTITYVVKQKGIIGVEEIDLIVEEFGSCQKKALPYTSLEVPRSVPF